MYSCTSPCEVSWVVFFARLVQLLEETSFEMFNAVAS